MTDNDAAKALDDIVTAYCMSLGMDPPIPDPLSQTAEQVKLIRTKLAKSAKVDGLLTALLIAKRDFKNWISNKEAREAAIASIDTAIQRFNGEG